MIHRNINTKKWTRMTIDSCFERGDLVDWQELFRAAKNDYEVAKDILVMARRREADGTAALAESLVRKLHPELFASGLV